MATTTTTTSLVYLQLRGRGELPRLVLEEAGAEYSYVAHAYPELPALKPSLPFGQLPVLKVGEWQLPESLAIARYLAKKHGLYGSTAEVQAVADAVVDAANEAMEELYRALLPLPPAEHAAAGAAWKKDKLPGHLAKFERAFALYGAASGFVAGELTYADLALFMVLDYVADALPATGAVAAHYRAIAARPNIAAYVASRRAPAYLKL